jgi:hypothetical protein
MLNLTLKNHLFPTLLSLLPIPRLTDENRSCVLTFVSVVESEAVSSDPGLANALDNPVYRLRYAI